jgi:hypothetical protein
LGESSCRAGTSRNWADASVCFARNRSLRENERETTFEEMMAMKIRRPVPAQAIRWIAGFIALTVAAFSVGCRSVSVVKFGDSSQKERRAAELESLLDRYTREFSETVEQAADEIVNSAPDLQTKRATVRWKLKVIPRVKELKRTQVRQGETLLALWLYTEAMLRYYEQGEGSETFGAGQPIAIAACKELSGKIENVARQALDSEEDFAAAREVIHDYAQQFSLRQRDSGAMDYRSVEAGIMELTGSAGALEWIPSFSLEAFNPFAGLSDSAAAIRHFTDKTNAVIDDVYTELPWRLELLLYDIEGRETVRDTSADLKRFSESAVSLAKTADRLPADMKGVVRATLDEIDVKQEGLRLTLQQTEDALMRAEGLVSGLSQTAASLADAGKAWDSTFQTLGLGDGKEASESSAADQIAPGGAPEVAAPAKAGRPFDILEYRDTAEELRNVAIELRGLVQDVHALTGSKEGEALLRNIELATQTATAAVLGQGRDLVDHAALRLLQLVGAILVAAILYRVVASRLTRQPPAAGS